MWRAVCQSVHEWRWVSALLFTQVEEHDGVAVSATPRAPSPRLRIYPEGHSWKQFAQYSASSVTIAHMGRHVFEEMTVGERFIAVAWLSHSPHQVRGANHHRYRVSPVRAKNQVCLEKTCQSIKASRTQKQWQDCLEAEGVEEPASLPDPDPWRRSSHERSVARGIPKCGHGGFGHNLHVAVFHCSFCGDHVGGVMRIAMQAASRECSMSKMEIVLLLLPYVAVPTCSWRQSAKKTVGREVQDVF